MADQPKGLALTIGINQVDPRFYSSAPTLAGCVNDARDVAAIARAQKFTVMPSLFDAQATAAALESGLEEAASRLVAGDLFLLHYSGHGMDTGKLNSLGDLVTAWCLFDGPYTNDTLFNAWFKFQPGVRIVVLSDSCHSGTAVRDLQMRAPGPGGLPVPIPRCLSEESQEQTIARNPGVFRALGQESDVLEARNQNRVPQAAVVLLSGCKDEETSGDLPTNGLFTGTLKQVWNDGQFQGDLDSFLTQISQKVAARARQSGQSQTPQLFPIGDPMLAGNIAAMPPFQI